MKIIKTPIEIPERMKHLPVYRDYPIPHGVMIDADGLPHFAMNDELRRRSMVKNGQCSICGTSLFRGRWFVGGVLSAFHEFGAFIDPPMHSECAKYALQVCPYLAAPRYAKEVGLAKAEKADFAGAMVYIADPTQIPGRPTGDVFVALMATKYTILDNFNTKPIPPYSVVEFWRHGLRISDPEGYSVVENALSEPLPEPLQNADLSNWPSRTIADFNRDRERSQEPD